MLIHGGEESLVEWQVSHGPLPVTVESITGGGGRQLYFSAGDIALRSMVAVAKGIDLRADGGLVVVPPSLHPSGNLYRWREGRGPSEIALASLPTWLTFTLLRRGHRCESASNRDPRG
jgi:hypothetical protein